jgi:hypothetical protein
MAKTGFHNELLLKLERNYVAHQHLASTKEAAELHEGLAATLNLLKEVHKTHDLNIALDLEQIMLHQELERYANSKEESDSIAAGIKQIQEAKKSLNVVRDPQAYQTATETYSGKRKEAGLPIDSFREFLKSHSTRLSNRMAGQISVPEKNILRQRKENLGMAREVYIAMQREALGLGVPAPEKSQGRER